MKFLPAVSLHGTTAVWVQDGVLYLGSELNASNLAELQHLQIKRILNVAADAKVWVSRGSLLRLYRWV